MAKLTNDAGETFGNKSQREVELAEMRESRRIQRLADLEAKTRILRQIEDDRLEKAERDWNSGILSSSPANAAVSEAKSSGREEDGPANILQQRNLAVNLSNTTCTDTRLQLRLTQGGYLIATFHANACLARDVRDWITKQTQQPATSITSSHPATSASQDVINGLRNLISTGYTFRQLRPARFAGLKRYFFLFTSPLFFILCDLMEIIIRDFIYMIRHHS
ncbi:unnamed protein product [Protopolystoma xenopodis]|uniref:UBX domain-containing protein n=1 Tax=Protopolystoma xenopodis TaxID=117903 RepID=A0A448WMY0_9PLAT|nr:unnamed protein product [Protopolystoma xenopodis]